MKFNLINSLIGLALILIGLLIIYIVRRQKRNKYFSHEIDYLDEERNIIDSMPILSELTKVETIIKNDKMEDKYNIWKSEYKFLKENNVIKLNDLIIELIMLKDNKEYETFDKTLNEAEIELYIAKNKAKTLLDEIKEINLSEEKYRSLIIKLKTKYRELNNTFNDNIDNYKDLADIISLQFENIERRFQDFEEFMEKNEYSEVVHIVKAIDTMTQHMDTVIKEVPGLITLATVVIPRQIEGITDTYEDMLKLGYKLSYLNIPSNMEDAIQNVNRIMDRIKVLNLVECRFELITMKEYLEGFFAIFEEEQRARKEYEDLKPVFEDLLLKVNKGVSGILKEIDDVKNTYIVDNKEIDELNSIKKEALELTKGYKKISKSKKTNITFKDEAKAIKLLYEGLTYLDERLQRLINKLGNLYDDEKRAIEESHHIEELLLKTHIMEFKTHLPVDDTYYKVEFDEAMEALDEVNAILKVKPKSIDKLNAAVDLARDLSIKIYDKTLELNEYYKTIESLYVYTNRLRFNNPKINNAALDAKALYMKGSYKEAKLTLIDALKEIDPEIETRLS